MCVEAVALPHLEFDKRSPFVELCYVQLAYNGTHAPFILSTQKDTTTMG